MSPECGLHISKSQQNWAHCSIVHTIFQIQCNTKSTSLVIQSRFYSPYPCIHAGDLYYCSPILPQESCVLNVNFGTTVTQSYINTLHLEVAQHLLSWAIALVSLSRSPCTCSAHSKTQGHPLRSYVVLQSKAQGFVCRFCHRIWTSKSKWLTVFTYLRTLTHGIRTKLSVPSLLFVVWI